MHTWVITHFVYAVGTETQVEAEDAAQAIAKFKEENGDVFIAAIVHSELP